MSECSEKVPDMKNAIKPFLIFVCVCVFVQVTSWYRGNETWDSRFSTIASSYEECRAECVGLYLCLNKQVLRYYSDTKLLRPPDGPHTCLFLGAALCVHTHTH